MEVGNHLRGSRQVHLEDFFSRSSEKSGETDGVCRNESCRSRLVEYSGADEIFSVEMWRAALIELVATAALMFTFTTSIISCLDSEGSNQKILVPIAVFVNVFLFLLVTVPLSGGHMNPIFSFIAALKGVITPARAVTYILAQCIGSVIGFMAIKSVMSDEAAHKFSLGGCALNGLNHEAAFFLEFFCTFLVLLIGVTVAFDEKRSKELGLLIVCTVLGAVMAVLVFVSVTVTGHPGYGGVGLNPARCLGAALVEGRGLWDGHWVFWIGPCLACVIYYGFSLHLPRDGSVSADDDCGKLKLAGRCCIGSPSNDKAQAEV